MNTALLLVAGVSASLVIVLLSYWAGKRFGQQRTQLQQLNDDQQQHKTQLALATRYRRGRAALLERLRRGLF